MILNRGLGRESGFRCVEMSVRCRCTLINQVFLFINSGYFAFIGFGIFFRFFFSYVPRQCISQAVETSNVFTSQFVLNTTSVHSDNDCNNLDLESIVVFSILS